MSLRFSYYPGCRLSGKGAEYGASVEAVFARLGYALAELPGWSCCGEASGHAVAPRAAHALSAHNLAIAAAVGKPLVAPCAICYGNLRAAAHAAATGDSEFPDDFPAVPLEDIVGVEVLSPLQVLSAPEALIRMREAADESLGGFRVACYYGCLLTRPPEYAGGEDVANPLSMERLLEALGAETVDWSYKTECCGGALGAPAERVVLELAWRIISAAEEAGANCIAVACPLCHWNLDIRQFEISKRKRRKVEMPIFYFSELIAVAFDLPKTEKWLKRHMTTVFPLIDEIIGFE